MKKRFVLPLVLAPAAVAAQHAARVRFVAPELRHQRLYQVTEVASRAVLKYRRATTKDRPWDPRVEVLSVPQGYVYTPPGAREDAIMLWVHGGGTIMGSPEHDHDVVSGYALELGVEILSARYRLAPEHPFPAAHDDLWQALGWLRLKYPGRKIIIAGSSGGAGMAAGLVQRAVDHGIELAGQVLVYPMLDNAKNPGRRSEGVGEFLWTPPSNDFAWKCYLGQGSADQDYAVPSRRDNLSGLPPTWIGVGDLDLFVDEACAYHDRLQLAGVPSKLFLVKGMYHAADRLCPQAPSMVEFTTNMLGAINGFLDK